MRKLTGRQGMRTSAGCIDTHIAIPQLRWRRRVESPAASMHIPTKLRARQERRWKLQLTSGWNQTFAILPAGDAMSFSVTCVHQELPRHRHRSRCKQAARWSLGVRGKGRTVFYGRSAAGLYLQAWWNVPRENFTTPSNFEKKTTLLCSCTLL